MITVLLTLSCMHVVFALRNNHELPDTSDELENPMLNAVTPQSCEESSIDRVKAMVAMVRSSSTREYDSPTTIDLTNVVCPHYVQSDNAAERMYRESSCTDPASLLNPFVADEVADVMRRDHDFAGRVRCRLKLVAEAFQFRPHDIVLDWGSGCGYHLDFFKRVYNVAGLGADLSSDGVEFSTRSGWADKACAGDASKLGWVPDKFVHAVISSLSIDYLPNVAKCQLMKQHILRVLRPGGCAYFGQNNYQNQKRIKHMIEDPPLFWTSCFASEPVRFQILSEPDAFGDDFFWPSQWTRPKHYHYSLFFCRTDENKTVVKSGAIPKQVDSDESAIFWNAYRTNPGDLASLLLSIIAPNAQRIQLLPLMNKFLNHTLEQAEPVKDVDVVQAFHEETIPPALALGTPGK